MASLRKRQDKSLWYDQTKAGTAAMNAAKAEGKSRSVQLDEFSKAYSAVERAKDRKLERSRQEIKAKKRMELAKKRKSIIPARKQTLKQRIAPVGKVNIRK